MGQGRRAASLAFPCSHACIITCLCVYLHVCMYACMYASFAFPRRAACIRVVGRVTMCVCSATAPGDGQHSRLRAASSQRLRLFCLADRAQHHAELLEGAARANRACFLMLPRALLQHAHKIQDVGISGAAGDLAHDDQCGMEDVVQHTLRICRFDRAAAGVRAVLLRCWYVPCCVSRDRRTLAMRVAQLESESRREKEASECRAPPPCLSIRTTGAPCRPRRHQWPAQGLSRATAFRSTSTTRNTRRE